MNQTKNKMNQTKNKMNQTKNKINQTKSLKINTELEYIYEQNQMYFSIPFPDPILKHKITEPKSIKFWDLDLGRRIEQDNINVAIEYSLLEEKDRMQKEAEEYLQIAQTSFNCAKSQIL